MKKYWLKFTNNSGQSTVEFAIVTSALIVIVVALGLIWRVGDDGMLVQHAISSASHHLSEAAAGIIGDVFSC